MGNPEALSVDPAEVTAHAKNVQTLMESLTLSLEAATYLGNCDDGFGAIPRPFVKMIFEEKQTNTISAISKLSEAVSALPGKLKTVAETFNEKDADFSKALTALQEQIAESGGTK
ncbi:type VII secretion target [Nocardia sp. NPDC127579]|uniref:type VII secretion target n=1 Tax=Nocardia sp. NPDC127579 TaxID=3345402 RepID=UPI0036365BEC